MRYGAGIVKWTADKLKNVDRKSRKIKTMHGAFLPKSDRQVIFD